jgi:hypothetical protein
MKYFMRVFIGCCICFMGVMAGMQFAKGNVGVGIFDLLLAVPSFINLARDFD